MNMAQYAHQMSKVIDEGVIDEGVMAEARRLIDPVWFEDMDLFPVAAAFCVLLVPENNLYMDGLSKVVYEFVLLEDYNFRFMFPLIFKKDVRVCPACDGEKEIRVHDTLSYVCQECFGSRNDFRHDEFFGM